MLGLRTPSTRHSTRCARSPWEAHCPSLVSARRRRCRHAHHARGGGAEGRGGPADRAVHGRRDQPRGRPSVLLPRPPGERERPDRVHRRRGSVRRRNGVGRLPGRDPGADQLVSGNGGRAVERHVRRREQRQRPGCSADDVGEQGPVARTARDVAVLHGRRIRRCGQVEPVARRDRPDRGRRAGERQRHTQPRPSPQHAEPAHRDDGCRRCALRSRPAGGARPVREHNTARAASGRARPVRGMATEGVRAVPDDLRVLVVQLARRRLLGDDRHDAPGRGTRRDQGASRRHVR